MKFTILLDSGTSISGGYQGSKRDFINEIKQKNDWLEINAGNRKVIVQKTHIAYIELGEEE